MDRMKLLKLQIVIGIITSCIGIVTIMYGVNFYNHPSRGNIVTCIADFRPKAKCKGYREAC